jgi:hypothetical protein
MKLDFSAGNTTPILARLELIGRLQRIRRIPRAIWPIIYLSFSEFPTFHFYHMGTEVFGRKSHEDSPETVFSPRENIELGFHPGNRKNQKVAQLHKVDFILPRVGGVEGNGPFFGRISFWSCDLPWLRKPT